MHSPAPSRCGHPEFFRRCGRRASQIEEKVKTLDRLGFEEADLAAIDRISSDA